MSARLLVTKKFKARCKRFTDCPVSKVGEIRPHSVAKQNNGESSSVAQVKALERQRTLRLKIESKIRCFFLDVNRMEKFRNRRDEAEMV